VGLTWTKTKETPQMTRSMRMPRRSSPLPAARGAPCGAALRAKVLGGAHRGCWGLSQWGRTRAATDPSRTRPGHALMRTRGPCMQAGLRELLSTRELHPM